MKDSTKAGIDRHVKLGVPTGDFLYAVLTNNLKEAIGTADEENMADLAEIVRYCYMEIPGSCWGSPDKVKEWQQMKQEYNSRGHEDDELLTTTEVFRGSK